MTDNVKLSDWQLLNQVTHIFRSVSDSFMDQVDMPRGQAMVLCTVARQDGMTQSEIADQLSVQGATVTTMLQKMEESGLVIRRRDQADNRLVRVYLTDIAKDKERAINAQFVSLEDKVFAGIEPADRTRLRELMFHLLKNMNEAK